MLIQNSAVKHIEQIHQDEAMEADCVEYKSVCWKASINSWWFSDKVESFIEEHKDTEVHENANHNDLVGCMDNYLSPHLG